MLKPCPPFHCSSIRRITSSLILFSADFVAFFIHDLISIYKYVMQHQNNAFCFILPFLFPICPLKAQALCAFSMVYIYYFAQAVSWCGLERNLYVKQKLKLYKYINTEKQCSKNAAPNWILLRHTGLAWFTEYMYSQGSPENVEDNGCPPIVLIGCLGRAKIVLNENLFTYNLFILDQICTVLWKDKQDFCCVIHVLHTSKYDGWKLNQLNVCFNVLSTTISVIYVNWQSPKDSNSFNGLSTISTDSTLEFYKI